ncbi:MAG: hypothetical protein GNW80_11845 [Asgard group archaeon]|nr:hypothetical protein [Asgard group archaeon]
MEFEQYGKEVDNLEIKFNPMDFAESNLFKDISNFLGYIKKNRTDIYPELIKRLNASKENLPKNRFFDEKSTKIIERISQCEVLTENKDLVLRYLNAFIEALKHHNDPDIAYIASCYIGDIAEWNEGEYIHLRRTQTLHHAVFCDELYWDTRVHDNPVQPSLEFTKNIGKK